MLKNIADRRKGEKKNDARALQLSVTESEADGAVLCFVRYLFSYHLTSVMTVCFLAGRNSRLVIDIRSAPFDHIIPHRAVLYRYRRDTRCKPRVDFFDLRFRY